VAFFLFCKAQCLLPEWKCIGFDILVLVQGEHFSPGDSAEPRSLHQMSSCISLMEDHVRPGAFFGNERLIERLQRQAYLSHHFQDDIQNIKKIIQLMAATAVNNCPDLVSFTEAEAGRLRTAAADAVKASVAAHQKPTAPVPAAGTNKLPATAATSPDPLNSNQPLRKIHLKNGRRREKRKQGAELAAQHDVAAQSAL